MFYAFGPFISAIGLTLYHRGRFGIKSLLRPILKWRVGSVWYACALAIPIIAQWLALGLWRSWTGYGVKLPSPADAAQTWLIATPVIAAFIVTEETGWRGFALPRLQSCSKALSASLVLGVCWSFWHFPLEIAIEHASGESAKTILLSLALFTASTMLFSVLMTWIFNSSSGSLLLMLLMHGSNNASLFIVADALGQGGDVDLTFRVFYMLSLLFLVSVVLLGYGTKSISKSYKITFESLH